VTAENVPDFVDDASPSLSGLFAERREPSVLLIRAGGDVDLSQTADRLARQEPIPIDPQQFAQRSGVASIRLAFLPVVRLDQDHFMAAIVLQHADQPIVESAYFEDRYELFIVLQPIAGELLKEGVDLLRVRRDLPCLQDIPGSVAERNSDLAGVLVDSKVQHRDGSPVMGIVGCCSQR
jgi:hypothetical protein